MHVFLIVSAKHFNSESFYVIYVIFKSTVHYYCRTSGVNDSGGPRNSPRISTTKLSVKNASKYLLKPSTVPSSAGPRCLHRWFGDKQKCAAVFHPPCETSTMFSPRDGCFAILLRGCLVNVNNKERFHIFSLTPLGPSYPFIRNEVGG